MVDSIASTDVYGKPYAKSIPGVTKCKRPTFKNNIRGRVWSGCSVKDVNGEIISGWYETTWGTYVYFARVELDGDKVISAQWYKARFDDYKEFERDHHSIAPDLNQYAPWPGF